MDIGMYWGPVSRTAKVDYFTILNYKSTSNFKDMEQQAAKYIYFLNQYVPL